MERRALFLVLLFTLLACSMAFSQRGNCNPYDGTTTYGTPLVIAWHGLKFEDAFTDPEHGVQFNLAGDEGGRKPWVAWTKSDVDVEFLVLPDEKTGEVTSFKFHMFGNLTPQIPHVGEKLGGDYPNPYKSNGFEALARYDLPQYGGNGDGKIDAQDAVWNKLRLWDNYTHDGIYDPEKKPGEVRRIGDAGIIAIDVTNYEASTVVDKSGNKQLWVGHLMMAGASLEAVIYDVAFRSLPLYDSK